MSVIIRAMALVEQSHGAANHVFFEVLEEDSECLIGLEYLKVLRAIIAPIRQSLTYKKGQYSRNGL